ncbi:MAG TPA: PqqD family protein [Solirubrobacteraceae bacterium]|nr:PqqD family protein [Solirubrobacteraceae bacterium]
MPPETAPSAAELVTAKIRVPQHVVYRSFPAETVVLNLQTGRYHGLNATAGNMLAALERADSVRAAAVVVAGEYEQPAEAVERDMCELCNSLLARGLVELDGDAPR